MASLQHPGISQISVRMGSRDGWVAAVGLASSFQEGFCLVPSLPGPFDPVLSIAETHPYHGLLYAHSRG